MLLYSKTGAASARSGGIGVLDGKSLPHEIIHEINFGTGHQRQGNRIDRKLRAGMLHDQIIGFRFGNQIKLVGKAGTAAAFHRKPQEPRILLLGDNGIDPLGGLFSQDHIFHFCLRTTRLKIHARISAPNFGSGVVKPYW